jgi:hypothetical protein
MRTTDKGLVISRQLFGQFAEHLGGCFADEYHCKSTDPVRRPR